MNSKVAKEWLEALVRTANEKDYDAHMDLISKRVQVFGVPGYEMIDYNAWAAQCKHEFENNLLKRVSYEGMKVRVMTPGRVMFKTKETVEGSDGMTNINPIEILLEREDDGKWRVVQERIISQEEYEHEGRQH